MARLLDILPAGALQAGDKRYAPSLAKTLVAAAKRKQRRGNLPGVSQAETKTGGAMHGADLNTDAMNTRPTTSKTRAKTAKETQANSESNSDGV